MVQDKHYTDNYLGDTAIGQIDKLLPDAKTLRSISTFYSIFSDSTRVKIISALSISEMCVGDLAVLLDTHQSTISHQLKILRSYGIVGYRRSGKMIFYYTDNVLIDDVMSIGIENMKNRLLSMY